MSRPVIIVGGGVAGLSAATALAERGIRVLVLEARSTLGGRASTFTDPLTKERVDNGQHVLFGCYDETFRFLKRIGTEQNVRLQQRLEIAVIDRDGRATTLWCPPMPAPLHLLGGLFSWDALSWRDCLAATRILPGVYGSPAFAGTVRQWLIARGQTQRLIELLWEPLAVAALNQSVDVAAADPFITVVRRLFRWRQRDSALAMPIRPLDELYADPSRRFVEQRGGMVRVGAPARVQLDPDLQVIVRGESIAADAVICAVPWFALAETVIDPKRRVVDLLEAAQHTKASPIVTVNLWFDRRVTPSAFVGLPGRAMQWVFDKSALIGDGVSHLSLVSSGADSLVARTNEELTRLALEELRAALPPARDAVLRRAVVVREKRATFSVAPGQPRRPAMRTRVAGFVLAGDWIDTGLPATIESAAASGHAAAVLAAAFVRDR